MTPPKGAVLESAHVAARVQEHDDVLKGSANNPGLLREVAELKLWKTEVLSTYRTIATVCSIIFMLGTAGVFTKLSQVQAAVEQMAQTAKAAAH